MLTSCLSLPLTSFSTVVWLSIMEADAHQRYPISRKNSEESDEVHSWPRSINANLQGKTLNLLPLMYHLELADIMFYVNSYKNRTPRYNILDYITPTAGYTRSSDNHRLSHKYSRTNTSTHFYYNLLPRLWNNLPPLNINLTSSYIKAN